MALTTLPFRFLQIQDSAPAPTPSPDATPTPLPPSQIEPEDLMVRLREAFAAFTNELMSWSSVWQLSVIVVAVLLGFAISRYPVKKLRAMAEARDANHDILSRLYLSLASVVWPAIIVLILWMSIALFTINQLPVNGLRVAASLMNAWIVVRLVATNVKAGFWSSAISVIAWTIAALYILRWLDPVVNSLRETSFPIAGQEVSVLKILTSIIIAVIALWIGRFAGDAAQSRLKTAKTLNPSIAGLLGQILKVGFMTIAILIAIQTLGIPLTALAVFTGALGVGIGFGLQAIFSNFISGIIILFEKSIKVGDFIELQSGVTGSVREINIRSTLVTTNDNVDILVPNEEFIKSQVINWTHRETLRRMKIPFGVAYGTKKELVRDCILEAVKNVKWTWDRPGREPQVWLVGFGDSSLNFELVVWITEDAVARPSKVIADYNWEILGALEANGIEIPFPQRDLHIRSSEPLPVRIETPNDKSDTKPEE
ncbi:MAG: mechanosensitive ion channel protein MscS [Hirschia sp.]|nr:mechanosensitive ion channel protein MscS [Hirschia sp.]MBF19581.1 mechanosensitive ion channel protein MscS [Hirschia sp.]